MRRDIRFPWAGQTGVGLIEVLVALLVMMFGLLALASLLSRTHTAEFESYQRKQAIVLLEDIAGRLSANRNAAPCYAVTTNASAGSPYLGTGGASIPTCASSTVSATPPIPSTDQATRANADLAAWSALLQGGAEVVGTTKVGAAMDAKGCISSTTHLLSGVVDYVEYHVSVAWKGTTALSAQSAANEIDINCAKNSYSDDQLRRVVSTVVRIPVMN